MLKSTLLSSMGSFVLGGGVALASLMAYTGTTDLQAIKDSVASYILKSEDTAMELINEYNVVVDEANGTIYEYKDALAEANSNISTLITAYEQQQAKYEADLAELQTEYDEMTIRLEEQYQADMNEVIQEANAQINQANEEAAQAKEEVQQAIKDSHIDTIVNNEERKELDTGGDTSVQDISGIVEEQPTEE